MTQAPSADLAIYSKEQEAQANNPYRIIAQTLLEMSSRKSFGDTDRQALQSLGRVFEQYQHELNLRAKFLTDQGINPSRHPDVFYELCRDRRNTIPALYGIAICYDAQALPNNRIAPVERQIGERKSLSPEATRTVLEELGFLTRGESLQSRTDRIPGEWKKNPRVFGDNNNNYEKREDNSLSRANAWWKPGFDKPLSITLRIDSPSLGPGLITLIDAPLAPDASGRIAVSDKIATAKIIIDGKTEADFATNLLRCAP